MQIRYWVCKLGVVWVCEFSPDLVLAMYQCTLRFCKYESLISLLFTEILKRLVLIKSESKRII